MHAMPPYTLTNESITVIWEGKPHNVQKGSPNFPGLKKAIMAEDWDAVPKHLTVAKGLEEWAKGRFALKNGSLCYDGVSLPSAFNERILSMASTGADPGPLFKFWERLQKNPSFRSVMSLWGFLQHGGIPLTEDGCFLAYKGVNDNFTDAHTGTISNKPGTINKMPRNQISDDPNHACHEGFHVGTRSFAQGYGRRLVVCKVDPENVVCVPYDGSAQKMRVCEYEVMGHDSVELSSTVVSNAEMGITQPNRGGDVFPEAQDEKEEKEEKDTDEDERDDDTRYEDNEEPPVTEEPAPAPVEEAPSVPEDTHSDVVVPKEYRKLHKLEMEGLLEENLDTLRKYATYGLKIVGASKIPGGKLALVSKILEAKK